MSLENKTPSSLEKQDPNDTQSGVIKADPRTLALGTSILGGCDNPVRETVPPPTPPNYETSVPSTTTTEVFETTTLPTTTNTTVPNTTTVPTTTPIQSPMSYPETN